MNITDSEIKAARKNATVEYLSVPVNFGSNDYATQVAEQDAFEAGFDAAIEWIRQRIPMEKTRQV